MDVEAFREQYRQDKIGPRYSGPLHLAFTTTAALAIIVGCASRVVQPRWWELLVIPFAFLFANFAEYMGHRYSMHRPRFPRFVYRRHTIEHHAFFTAEQMSYASTRDWKVVLFPPGVVLFFFLGFGAPVGVLLALLATPNVALLFVATAFGYFLTYEWLHFSYHMSPDSWVGRLGIVRRLRAHHEAHHDQTLMSHKNFNITFPIIDWIAGTIAKR